MTDNNDAVAEAEKILSEAMQNISVERHDGKLYTLRLDEPAMRMLIEALCMTRDQSILFKAMMTSNHLVGLETSKKILEHHHALPTEYPEIFAAITERLIEMLEADNGD